MLYNPNSELTPESKKNNPQYPQLKIKITSAAEYAQIQECCGSKKEDIKHDSDKGEGAVVLVPTEMVFALMLGGRASTKGTKAYVNEIIEHAKKTGKPATLFVLTGRNDGQDSLFNQVVEQVRILQQANDYPAQLKIVPLSYQTDAEIAPLLARSDVAIIKSGGISSMEAFQTCSKQIFIHSIYEGSSTPPSLEELQSTKNMIEWEVGNANYLMKKKGAKIVCPKTIRAEMEKIQCQ